MALSTSKKLLDRLKKINKKKNPIRNLKPSPKPGGRKPIGKLKPGPRMPSIKNLSPAQKKRLLQMIKGTRKK